MEPKSVYDFDLNDIFIFLNLSFEYSNNYCIHLSEITFEEFARQYNKPITDELHTRYFMFITPYNFKLYFQNQDKSVKITYTSIIFETYNKWYQTTNSLSKNKEITKFFFQKVTFNKEFNTNLLIAISEYLGLNNIRIQEIKHFNKHTFYVYKYKDYYDQKRALEQSDLENTEYYYIYLILNPVNINVNIEIKIAVKIINDLNNITVLDLIQSK